MKPPALRPPASLLGINRLHRGGFFRVRHFVCVNQNFQACLEITDQLKELGKAGRIASWEMFRGELVLYWRSLRAGESVQIPVSLKAMIPGVYTAPASRAWLYYTEELKNWCPGVKAEIL